MYVFFSGSNAERLPSSFRCHFLSIPVSSAAPFLSGSDRSLALPRSFLSVPFPMHYFALISTLLYHSSVSLALLLHSPSPSSFHIEELGSCSRHWVHGSSCPASDVIEGVFTALAEIALDEGEMRLLSYIELIQEYTT